jgi:putative ABC transport system permease protein
VSASFARYLMTTGNAGGWRIQLPYRRFDEEWPVVRVIGVVPDVITNVTATEPFTLYLSLSQHPDVQRTELVIMARQNGDEAAREVTAAARSIDPAARPVVSTLRDQLARQMMPQQFGVFVLGVLGGVALLLTLLGTYVLAESAAVLRTREIGIRAALGATRAQLAAIVLGEATRLVGSGVLAGAFLAWTQARLIRSFLFRVQPLDPTTLATVGALLLGLAALVSIRPAFRAARVDLARILKSQ